MSRRMRRLSSSQIIILGFVGAILTGCLLLMLPVATKDGQGASFFDALFTATSAVCVTGLVVQDTATYWSSFGQSIILLLIQIGGLGVVTIVAVISLISGRKIGLKQRSTMQEAIAAPAVGGIVRLTGFLVCTTLGMELLGALALAPVFCRDFGLLRGIWYAVFHSVSAFCNAGFDLMGVNAPYSSLTAYAADPVVNITIMVLIVFGGLGFMTWEDMRRHGVRLRRYSMQSKLILTMTGMLLLLATAYGFFFEYAQEPLGARIWLSLFQSVTPRTAGFNTADLTKLSESGIGVMILMMLIGGSPGSTAGGMKTTTLAALLFAALAVFRREEDTHAFGRRIHEHTVRSAAVILMMYIVLFVSGGLIISRVEGLPLLTCLFETASAVGTVGLTLGITPGLSLLSRVILILLMYLGRAGGLTLVFAALSVGKNNGSRYPLEQLNVG